MFAIRLRLLFPLAAVCLVAWTAQAARVPDAAVAYIERGRQTEARQKAYHERIARFHRSLSEALKASAPDLLPTLATPPSNVYGYQILPRIVADATPLPAGTQPQVASYSWRSSDTLIERETTAIDRSEVVLSKVQPSRAWATRVALKALILTYNTILDRRRIIDANISYNWLWQRQIATDRPLFDRLTTHLDGFVQRQARAEPATGGDEGPAIGFDPPPFARFERPTDLEQVVTVDLITDVADAAVVRAFVEAVETHWHVRQGQHEYRLRLITTVIPPDRLYCGRADQPAERARSTAPCAPPAHAEKIDLKAHVARFPDAAAVFTTGADSLQLSGSRAIVLGPHDVAPRTLAHEFGHVLGFPDAYLRGYRDRGADGFEVLELVPDLADIMSSPGFGSVLPRHFEGLIAATEIQTEMQAGLAALYRRNDPAEAAARFRAVLARNPAHYGATLQLAKTLDRSGNSGEALTLWTKVLGMAETARDSVTVESARARLAEITEPN